MYSWVASWFSEDPNNDESIYTEESSSTSQEKDDSSPTKEWTWIETITDKTTKPEKHIFIQSSHIVDDKNNVNKASRRKKLMSHRKAYNKLSRGLLSRSLHRSRIVSLKERRYISNMNSYTERALVRYYRSSLPTSEILSNSLDTSDTLTSSLLNYKPVVRYIMEMDINPTIDNYGCKTAFL